jgi:hypothetical protein
VMTAHSTQQRVVMTAACDDSTQHTTRAVKDTAACGDDSSV